MKYTKQIISEMSKEELENMSDEDWIKYQKDNAINELCEVLIEKINSFREEYLNSDAYPIDDFSNSVKLYIDYLTKNYKNFMSKFT